MSAMYNLRLLLKNGGEGVENVLGRAVQLYEQAIDEGQYVRAMSNLGLLFEIWGEGVENERGRAV